MNAKPISEKNVQGCSPIVTTVFGLLFFILGLVLSWFMFVVPLRNHVAAQGWSEAECKIISGKIESRSSDDGTSYEPIIKYKYWVDKQIFAGDRISFTRPNSSSRRARAETVLAKFPVGATVACFYDPQRPEQSVLEQEFAVLHWLMLLPLLFSMVGIGIMLIPSLSEKRDKMGRSPSLAATQSAFAGIDVLQPRHQVNSDGSLSEADQLDQVWDGPQKLRPTSQKKTMLIGVALIAVIWNGVISIMVFNLAFELNLMSIVTCLFLVPFVLVGLLMIAGFFHQLMALSNPKIEVALSTGAVPLGGELDVAWEIPKRSSRIGKLTIHVQGVESATYRQGTDTKTDIQMFADIPVVDTANASEISFGSTTIQIPSGSMHTLEGRHNKISWTLNVQGEIAYWPDLTEEFAFRVKPDMPRQR